MINGSKGNDVLSESVGASGFPRYGQRCGYFVLSRGNLSTLTS